VMPQGANTRNHHRNTPIVQKSTTKMPPRAISTVDRNFPCFILDLTTWFGGGMANIGHKIAKTKENKPQEK
jgi:hypothetical protein